MASNTPTRKTVCPKCGRERFTQSPRCICTACLTRWTIDWSMSPEEFWSFNASPKARRLIAAKAAQMGIDPKALHILFNTQWNLDGREGAWIGFSEVPPPDLEYAQAAGLMHDALELDHRSLLARIVKARERTDRRAVAAAFAASLVTQRLDTRSTLGSLAHALYLGSHRFAAEDRADDCRECGFPKKKTIPVNHYTFRRLMWAGNVCQGDLGYVLCDLRRSQRRTRTTASRKKCS